MKRKEVSGLVHSSTWQLFRMEMLKLNFDPDMVRISGSGAGLAIRNEVGDIVLVGCKQGGSFVGLETEKARACLFGLQCAKEVSSICIT